MIRLALAQSLLLVASSLKTGVFDPPQIGQFDHGRGEFYAQDSWQGRAIYIRLTWRVISATSTWLEQAFSVDGGRTWQPNWIYEGTRVKP